MLHEVLVVVWDRVSTPETAPRRGLANRVSALREGTAAAAFLLADSEEEVARVHDWLASRDPGNPDCQRLDREAREAARSARETEWKYSKS